MVAMTAKTHFASRRRKVYINSQRGGRCGGGRRGWDEGTQ